VDVIDAAGSYLIPGVWDMHVHSVRSPEAVGARAVIDRLADAGADFIKPYENLSREAYFDRGREPGWRSPGKSLMRLSAPRR
jgi:predicted amidohydrolase YtcJ